MSSASRWQVYLLECRDGSLYTGVAVDVARRYALHLAGKAAKYTRSRPPRRLLAVIETPGRREALRLEYAIKQLAPAGKRAFAAKHSPAPELLQLIASTPPARPRAAESPSGPTPASTATAQGTPSMLRIGDKAPSFSLASDSGKTIASASLKGQRYILYFYPKDDTPACTKEACAFRDGMPGFGRLGVPVFGVSADNEKAHAKFAGKYDLNFPLLSDPDRALIEAYGAWVEKSLYGRKYMGIQRCTYAIGADGRIAQAWDKVKPDTHADEVLAWLKDGGTGAAKVAASVLTPAKPPTKKAAKAKTKAATKNAAPAKTAAATKRQPAAGAGAKLNKAAAGKATSKPGAVKKTARRKA